MQNITFDKDILYFKEFKQANSQLIAIIRQVIKLIKEKEGA